MRLYFARFLVIAGFFAFCCADRQESYSQQVTQVVNVPQNPGPGQGAGDDAVPRGVEVQARGPIHEAFATPTGEPKPTGAVNKRPPAAVDEMAPEEKPEGDMTWIGGYWAWDDDRADYLWVSGCWRAKPQGKDWVPGYWREQGDLWQWAPGFWANAATKEAPAQEVTYYPEPPAPPQLAPPGDPPNSDMIYVPGNYFWYGDRYTWRAGYWTRGRAGYVYVASHYRWTPSGYVFVPGYWDLAVANRGVLYAPITIDPVVVVGGRFVYTPYYAVPGTLMLDALFIRPATCHYYFGDYYGPRYRTLGFESSVVYSRHHYDAIVVAQRWEYRDNPHWFDLRVNLVIARDAGRVPLPPRTFVRETIIVNGVARGAVLAPARTVMAAQGFKTVHVDAVARAEIRASSHAVQQAALQQRQRTEVATPGAQNQSKPRVASYSVPASAVHATSAPAPAVHSTTTAPAATAHPPAVPASASLGNTAKGPGTPGAPAASNAAAKKGPAPVHPADSKKDDGKKKAP